MPNFVTRYKKILRRNLSCTGNTKKQLLQKFERSLSVFLEDTPTPDMDELCAAFGPPKEMASVLMAEVPQKEVARYRARKIVLWSILGCIGACFLVYCILLGVELYKHNLQPITSTDEIIIDDVSNSEDEIIVDDEIIVEDEIVIED